MLFDDGLILLVRKSSRVHGAWFRSSTAFKAASWLVTGGVGQMKASAVESQAKIQLRRLHNIAPKQVKRKFDLCKVQMSVNFVADRIRRIPDTVQIVAHNVDEVHIIHCLEVKMPKVPKTCWNCE